jgi:hypothetical protein
VRDSILDGHFCHGASHFQRFGAVIKLRKQVAMNVNHEFTRITQEFSDNNRRCASWNLANGHEKPVNEYIAVSMRQARRCAGISLSLRSEAGRCTPIRINSQPVVNAGWLA